MKDHARALADLEEAIHLNPNSAGILNSRGHTYRATGDSPSSPTRFGRKHQRSERSVHCVLRQAEPMRGPAGQGNRFRSRYLFSASIRALASTAKAQLGKRVRWSS
jgi:hypothetical protein